MTATPTQAESQLTKRALSAFLGRFHGDVITPEAEAYGEPRRVWNGMINRYPAAIARCADTRDVAATIALAREQGVPLAVRGGGHSVPGFGVCDGGVVLDLSPLKSIEVDQVARRVRVGAGTNWGELDRATQSFGLAVTGGLVTTTGVGGLTLGGGIGHLMRRCGLTCDNLVGAELVTADGAVIQVNEEENPELLWGLRGGGGNFGVVTRFDFALHEVGPAVVAGAIFFPMAEARAFLRFYREWQTTLPDAMTTILVLRIAPVAPFLPPGVHGEPVIAMTACWSGRLDEGERLLEPVRRFSRPLADLVARKPYVEHQSMFDASAPPGMQNYLKSGNLSGLPDVAIDVVVEQASRMTSPQSVTQIYQLGGAVSRVPEHATAYSDRGAAFNWVIAAQWTDPQDPKTPEHIRWTREYHEALRSCTTGGVYVNFLMNEGQDRVRAAYGDAKYARLLALKQGYDPDNVLRFNQNISPP